MNAGGEGGRLIKCLLCSRQHTQLLAFSGLTPHTIPYGVVEYNDSCLSDEENKAQRSAVLSREKNLVGPMVPQLTLCCSLFSPYIFIVVSNGFWCFCSHVSGALTVFTPGYLFSPFSLLVLLMCLCVCVHACLYILPSFHIGIWKYFSFYLIYLLSLIYFSTNGTVCFLLFIAVYIFYIVYMCVHTLTHMQAHTTFPSVEI